MPKRESEFSLISLVEWHPVKDMPGGWERILSYDPDTGSYTRVLRLEKGFEGKETLRHDFWEEVYITSGSITDLRTGQTYTAAMYACRPPGMIHGPYSSREGFEGIEFRYYPTMQGNGAKDEHQP